MKDNLSDLKLISIYKALIIMEWEFKWIGGFIAYAIWIYRIINNRRLYDNYGLADYGLRNSINPYVPFRSDYNGERNIQDYFLHQKERARKRTNKLEKIRHFDRGLRIEEKDGLLQLQN